MFRFFSDYQKQIYNEFQDTWALSPSHAPALPKTLEGMVSSNVFTRFYFLIKRSKNKILLFQLVSTSTFTQQFFC